MDLCAFTSNWLLFPPETFVLPQNNPLSLAAILSLSPKNSHLRPAHPVSHYGAHYGTLWHTMAQYGTIWHLPPCTLWQDGKGSRTNAAPALKRLVSPSNTFLTLLFANQPPSPQSSVPILPFKQTTNWCYKQHRRRNDKIKKNYFVCNTNANGSYSLFQSDSQPQSFLHRDSTNGNWCCKDLTENTNFTFHHYFHHCLTDSLPNIKGIARTAKGRSHTWS